MHSGSRVGRTRLIICDEFFFFFNLTLTLYGRFLRWPWVKHRLPKGLQKKTHGSKMNYAPFKASTSSFFELWLWVKKTTRRNYRFRVVYQSPGMLLGTCVYCPGVFCGDPKRGPQLWALGVCEAYFEPVALPSQVSQTSQGQVGKKITAAWVSAKQCEVVFW